MSSRQNRWVAIGVVVTYNGWIAWPLNGNPLALAGYVSELAAQDQPFQWLFRTIEAISAVLIGWVAARGRRGWRPWLGAKSHWVSLALATVAIATTVDVVFNLPCAPSFDVVCRAAEWQRPLDPNHVMHTVASITVSAALVATIALALWGQVERAGWNLASTGLAAFGTVIGTLLVMIVIWQYRLELGHGYVQVAQIVLSSGWLAYLALRLQERGHA